MTPLLPLGVSVWCLSAFICSPELLEQMQSREQSVHIGVQVKAICILDCWQSPGQNILLP